MYLIWRYLLPHKKLFETQGTYSKIKMAATRLTVMDSGEHAIKSIETNTFCNSCKLLYNTNIIIIYVLIYIVINSFFHDYNIN